MLPGDRAVLGPAPGAALIAGIRSAELLLQRVRTDVSADLAVGVLGPGGCGKTALLAALRLEYQAAGIAVVGVEALEGERVPTDAVVLIDDAHTLTPVVLQRVRDLVGQRGSRMVVAFRPWPRLPAITAVAAALRRMGPLTVVQQLARTEVERRAVAVLAEPVPTALVELLTVQTGGHPLVLDEVLATLCESGPDRWAADPQLQADVIDRLRFVVDDLDGATRALLHVVAAGAQVETGVLAALLELEPAAVRVTLEQARAGGWLLRDGRLIPLFCAALLSGEPVERTREIQLALLDIHADRGHDVVPIALALARRGIRNETAARTLVSAGDAKLATEPATAVMLYSEAVRAGTAAGDVAVRRAEGALAIGQLDAALRLADPVLADAAVVDPAVVDQSVVDQSVAGGDSDLARAIAVVATVMAHRGQLGRAAELYGWLGPERVGAAAPMAALALLATGEPQKALAFVQAPSVRQSPTMLAGAMALIVDGVQASLTDCSTSALSALSRATSLLESVGCGSLLLDSPAALTGLVAINVGEFDLAESVLRRAVRNELCGPLARPRHLLLLAWIAMLTGRYSAARALIAQATPAGSVTESRDEIFATALAVGLARRSGDMTVLAPTWQAAREAIVRQPVDLFVLLPLGEFAVAAAHVGESHLLDTHLKQAWSVLGRLGDPVLWSSSLQWACFQAEVVSQAVDDIDSRVQALGRAAPDNGYGRALAAAAQVWQDVVGGVAVTQAVHAAAAGLSSFGLGHDAAHLLGEASVRCGDRRAAGQFLHAARAIQGGAEPAPTAVRPADSGPADSSRAFSGGADSGHAFSGGADPGGTGSGRSSAGRLGSAGPRRADAALAAAGRADVGRADGARAEVGRAGAGRADGARADAARAEVGRAGAVRAEVGRAQAGPADVERAGAARADDPGVVRAVQGLGRSNGSRSVRTRSVLSDRELEVAELLLRNQTYREIGERLFISPKTVEHHVARMKQRVGVSRRSELFAELRALTVESQRVTAGQPPA